MTTINNFSSLRQILDDAAYYGGMSQEELDGHQKYWDEVKDQFPQAYWPVIEDRIALAQVKINRQPSPYEQG